MATSTWLQVLRLKSTQLFIVAGSVLISVLITLLCMGFTIRYEVKHEVANLSDVDYWKDRVSPQQKLWYDLGIEELQRAMRVYGGQKHPRHVLMLLVHGIDGRHLAAGRFTDSTLPAASFLWDRFPHLARLKNSCSSRSPCNAAAVSRVLWTGVPFEAIGGQLGRENCSQRQHLESVLRQAQMADFRTGFITNQRITGATAAALYADASWECNGLMPMAAMNLGCQDVAEQLLYSAAGQALNVIMGGGRQLLNSQVPTSKWDPVDEQLCRARGERNLLRTWRNQKLKLNPRQRFELVQHAEELSSLNATNLDYLLGVFANGNLYDNPKAPNLQLMMNKTLELLRRPSKRHLLFVEYFMEPKENPAQQLQHLNETLNHLLNQKDTLNLLMFSNDKYLKESWDVSGETELVDSLDDAFAGEDLQLQARLQEMSPERLVFAHGPKSFLFYGVHEETYLAQALSNALGLTGNA